jgi:hypothetical protein
MNKLIKEELIKTKTHLAWLLLQIPKSEISDEEVEIMVALSNDKDIQQILERAKNDKRS